MRKSCKTISVYSATRWNQASTWCISRCVIKQNHALV